MSNRPHKIIGVRRKEYDVINEVDVTDGECAVAAMAEIFIDLFPDKPKLRDLILDHGDQIARMYVGEHKDFRPCDTLYHDLQHTMDVSLCMARMLYGYERAVPERVRLGPEILCLGILAALYHDSGYILDKKRDKEVLAGASLTSTHVTRSSELMRERLREVSAFTDLVDDAGSILHYTGYEQRIEDVVLSTPILHCVGKMLGSSDLLAQTSDRCYLEKCLERLFPEFVLGGFDYSPSGDLVYESPRMLLLKTPTFYRDCVRRRLEENLNSYYHYVSFAIGGINHYAWWMESNLHYLQILIDQNRLDNLRRLSPDTYGADKFPYESMKRLMERKKESWRLESIERSRLGVGGSG